MDEKEIEKLIKLANINIKVQLQLNSLINKLKNNERDNINNNNNNINNSTMQLNNSDNNINNSTMQLNNSNNDKEQSIDMEVQSSLPPSQNTIPEPWPTIFSFPREKLSQTTIDKICSINSSTTYLEIYTVINELVNIVYQKMRDLKLIYPLQKHYKSAAMSISIAFPSVVNLNMKVNRIIF